MEGSSQLALSLSVPSCESISFLGTVITEHRIIQGLLWMQHRDPRISWHYKEITQWSKHCQHCCLHLPLIFVAFTMVESPNLPFTTIIPALLSITKASSLPPQRHLNTTGYGEVGPQSHPIRLHLSRYLSNLIYFLFFFVEKRGVSVLAMTTEDWIKSVKYPYPLPLFPQPWNNFAQPKSSLNLTSALPLT